MTAVFGTRIEISNPGEPVVPVKRCIDGFPSRTERLALLMGCFRICEERSNAVDRVVQTAESFQPPVPEFRSALRQTVVSIAGPDLFDAMERDSGGAKVGRYVGRRYAELRHRPSHTARHQFIRQAACCRASCPFSALSTEQCGADASCTQASQFQPPSCGAVLIAGSQMIWRSLTSRVIPISRAVSSPMRFSAASSRFASAGPVSTTIFERRQAATR